MKNSITFFVYFLSIFFSFSQSEKTIHGKVICDFFPVQGIKVINLITEKSTVTNNNGVFQITVMPNEMLVFSGLGYNYKRKSIEIDDVNKDNLVIEIEKKATQLEEVVVTKNPQFDAVNLGILDKPAVTYTPAERRLHEAKTGVINPLVNLISGRTKRLKSQLEIEKSEIIVAKLANMYSDDYYINKLKIAPDYIKAFQYYASSDPKLIGLMKSKNKSMMKFRMFELAEEFNNLQTDEK